MYKRQSPKSSQRKKKVKWLSEEVLYIAEERREMKGKGERERYTQLNAEFQRIARRVKNAFLSEWCKEIEENNRMRYQGTISCKSEVKSLSRVQLFATPTLCLPCSSIHGIFQARVLEWVAISFSRDGHNKGQKQ